MTLPHANPYAIRLRDVVTRLDGRLILDGVNLDIRHAETMVILGASGSGKSTLLRTMIGSLCPEQGHIELLGCDITQQTEDQLNQTRKQFGILFQSGALFNSMTLRQNVTLPLQEHTDLPPSTIEIIVKIKLELVGLREHADKYPAQVSGGMKKRAGLARALALDPKILFYDEPSAGLDPVTSAEIDQLITDLSKHLGITSVVVTHHMDSAFTVADRMAMLDQGRVLAVQDREHFRDLRDSDLASYVLSAEDVLIRQFLRGDPDGPMTDRRRATSYAQDLLGPVPGDRPRCPSIQATRKP